jgi:hypothetical protein
MGTKGTDVAVGRDLSVTSFRDLFRCAWRQGGILLLQKSTNDSHSEQLGRNPKIVEDSSGELILDSIHFWNCICRNDATADDKDHF